MIQIDSRIGGKPRYIITDKEIPLLRVPDEIRKCVIFVGGEDIDGTYIPLGTAFWVVHLREDERVWPFTYIVTARHVIDDICKKLDTEKIQLRLNFRDGTAAWLECTAGDWWPHPSEPEVDVAVYATAINREWDQRPYSLGACATAGVIEKFKIGTGDEVFLSGLFVNHPGLQKNIPIVRVGNIAAMPEEKVKTTMGMIDAYLIEARSIGGLSGSPVFVHLWPRETLDYATNRTGAFYLLGLMHGHFAPHALQVDVATNDAGEIRDRINMGIAIVVPVTKILEVVLQPKLKEHEDSAIEQWRASNLPARD